MEKFPGAANNDKNIVDDKIVDGCVGRVGSARIIACWTLAIQSHEDGRPSDNTLGPSRLGEAG